MVRICLIIIIFLLPFGSNAQNFPLEISEIHSHNQITQLNQQKLILIDFWATWCGPCKPATQQLEILQKQVKYDVFMVSITDETHEVVVKYLEKNPIQIMVLRDIGGNTIRHFNVSTRPYAVLLNTRGQLLWKGHPSNINYDDIKKFVRQQKTHPSVVIEDLFKKIETENTSIAKKANKKVELNVKRSESSQTIFRIENNMVEYKGSLFELFAKIYNVPSQQIIPYLKQDFYVQMQAPVEVWDTNPDSILNHISTSFNLQIVPEVKPMDVYFMEVTDSTKLWNTEQIDWGENNNSNYLIGENRIQADNITLADFSIILSNTKNKIFKYFGNNFEPYDWDLHFRFDELMEGELLNEFGITLEKKKLMVTHFLIQ